MAYFTQKTLSEKQTLLHMPGNQLVRFGTEGRQNILTRDKLENLTSTGEFEYAINVRWNGITRKIGSISEVHF